MVVVIIVVVISDGYYCGYGHDHGYYLQGAGGVYQSVVEGRRTARSMHSANVAR